MTARLPSLALRTARGGLAQGPVLVQVPRRGYLAAVACARCRAQARCATCAGPLEIGGSHGTPGCRWCGALATDWACARCGSGQLRALVTGAARTAEELGRAFPGVPVRTSGGPHVLAAVPAEPALVIATPGAEPVAHGGYAAALLLDGWALLGRPSLRAAEEALRRWLNAAALVRPGAPVVVLAEASLPAVQALIRWDPVTFSERELAERAELGFPPAVRMASVTGLPEAVSDFVGAAALPDRAEVLGPIPLEGAGGVRGAGSAPVSGGAGGSSPRGKQSADQDRPARRPGAGPGPARGAGHPQRAQGRRRGPGSARPGRGGLTDTLELAAPRGAGGRCRVSRRVFVSVKPIRLFGDPVLRTPAEPVRDFDAELRRLVKDLTETMLDAPGAGLAAPQIGVGLRVFTYHVDDHEPGHLINPSLDLSEDEDEDDEGCLSFPGLVYPVKRAWGVVAKGFNMYGDPVTIEGTELLARCIQHETDHLDGILFIDRMDEAQRKAAMKAIRDAEWWGDPVPRVRVSPHKTHGQAF